MNEARLPKAFIKTWMAALAPLNNEFTLLRIKIVLKSLDEADLCYCPLFLFCYYPEEQISKVLNNIVCRGAHWPSG